MPRLYQNSKHLQVLVCVVVSVCLLGDALLYCSTGHMAGMDTNTSRFMAQSVNTGNFAWSPSSMIIIILNRGKANETSSKNTGEAKHQDTHAQTLRVCDINATQKGNNAPTSGAPKAFVDSGLTFDVLFLGLLQ